MTSTLHHFQLIHDFAAFRSVLILPKLENHTSRQYVSSWISTYWRPKVAGDEKWDARLRQEWLLFCNNEGYYFSDHVEENPRLYWLGLKRFTETKELAILALEILGFPQSGASVERSFCAVRRIHTWQRSCIGRKKLAKLTFVYINRKALDGVEINWLVTRISLILILNKVINCTCDQLKLAQQCPMKILYVHFK